MEQLITSLLSLVLFISLLLVLVYRVDYYSLILLRSSIMFQSNCLNKLNLQEFDSIFHFERSFDLFFVKIFLRCPRKPSTFAYTLCQLEVYQPQSIIKYQVDYLIHYNTQQHQQPVLMRLLQRRKKKISLSELPMIFEKSISSSSLKIHVHK